MTVTVNAEQQTSSAAADGHDNAATSDNNNVDRDYISMDDLLQDTADDDDGGGGNDGDGSEPVRDPKTTNLFESIANYLDHDDVLFGSPSWLENFREMKQVIIDSLYKDCSKHWMVLRFNLQMLMLKARHGWSDTRFNDLLRILTDTYPEGYKVPANTYQAKKLIWPVTMKLKKFHACPNHCILYQGKYENLQSCLHCGTSRYKRNASVMWMRTMREGRRRRRRLRRVPRRSRSCLLRMRKKRVTRRGKV
jgi:hypothetical protein